MNDTTLLEIAKLKLRVGELPCDAEKKLWAGKGVGEACALCDRIILGSETEYEVDFSEGSDVKRFHPVCFAVWEMARVREC